MSSFLHFLFYIAIISGVTRGLSLAGKFSEEWPTSHCMGLTSQHSEKNNLRSDGEFGCGWLY